MVFLFILTFPISATEYKVPFDFRTIQDAVDGIEDEDVIIVSDGIYYENIVIDRSLSFVLKSQNGPDNCIIDGRLNGFSVLLFDFINTNDSIIIEGFTIKNGHSNSYGGGINFNHSDVYTELNNMRIINNEAELFGGGLSLIRSKNKYFNNCVIMDNNSTLGGGGIYCKDIVTAFFTRTSINNNNTSGMGSALLTTGTGQIGVQVLLEHVTISQNYSSNNSSIRCLRQTIINIQNSIIWGDTQPEIDIFSEGIPNLLSISYSDLQGSEPGIVKGDNDIVNWGSGNLNVDPLFVDPENQDYHLSDESECIDAGDPYSELDPDGTITDMGALFHYQWLMGDVNYDGFVSVEDIILLIGFILEINEPTYYEFLASDVNSDGVLNILDVVFLIEIILGTSFNDISSENDILISKELVIQTENNYGEETSELILTMLNEAFVRALKLKVNLPVGYKVNTVSKSDRTEPLDLTVNIPEDSTFLSFVLVGTQGQFVSPGSGEIVKVVMKPSGSLGRGSGDSDEGEFISVELANSADSLLDYTIVDEDGMARAISEIENEFMPETVTLVQNYPNPFNPVTTIHFTNKTTSHVTLKVYTVTGQLVETLIDKWMDTGQYAVNWNTHSDQNNKQLSSGIYFYQLVTSEYQLTRKMVLLK
tara:strand:- start:12954 stop:14897 length:1944 start_codon:yes stop_codon:yes gene_type:complete